VKPILYRAETPINSALEAVDALRANPPAEFKDCVVAAVEESPRIFLVQGWRVGKQVTFVVVGPAVTSPEVERDDSIFAFLMAGSAAKT
jgi:hypothetical protein